MFERIFDRYSKGIHKVIDTCASLLYWSLRITRYFFPLTIALVLLSFSIFSLTWILYLGFYWYWIPPKSISFPINFDFQNRYFSQLIPDNYSYSDQYFNKFSSSAPGLSKRNYQDNVYNNFINSNELSRQLMYEQSEASAILNFNNITWRYRNVGNKRYSASNMSLFNQTHYLENDDISAEKNGDINTGALSYFLYLKDYWSSKVYNFVTFNWYQRKKYYKGIDEGINRIIHKHVDSRFGNRMNSEIIGNEIDIIVELFYFPNQYNINISPFKISLDLIQCLEPHTSLNLESDIHINNSSKILASFKKTSTIEYLPQVVLRFKEYISIIPSLLGLQINSLGLGLESKVSIKLVENFPLQRKHPFNFTSLETHIKLCGAKVKMKPALHISKGHLIFQTKLPFWKEIIRNHPILMGNMISFIVTLFLLSLLFFIVFLSGIYFLWKKFPANNYNDYHLSNSFFPTGTATYTNSTPTSSNQINSNGFNQGNNQDFSSTKNIPLSNCEQLLIDYSMTNSSININGLLPLETKQISHPRNQYIGHSQSFGDRNSDDNIKSEENGESLEKSIQSPKSNSSPNHSET
ncbi:putative adipose-regulatory protein (Seipin) family protein [Cryptosporidium meleagridis]|uniref:Putative adipose-regulatory protein (Seipin) family protein n=1 Tax=Cryptosporidium meleagridis TaxID=93969 RepID=A0A2P4Z236_9CRYT|nr:putative adipose-regulatory protein (Seipin) family protein [Cryptosporidium meleagridis]